MQGRIVLSLDTATDGCYLTTAAGARRLPHRTASTGSPRRTARPPKSREQPGTSTASKAQLEPAAAHNAIKRRRSFGHHRGRAQRQVGDIGAERDPARLAHQRRDQRPGIKEVALIRMVLHADERQSPFVSHAYQLARPGERVGVGNDGYPDRFHHGSRDGRIRARSANRGDHSRRLYPPSTSTTRRAARASGSAEGRSRAHGRWRAARASRSSRAVPTRRRSADAATCLRWRGSPRSRTPIPGTA